MTHGLRALSDLPAIGLGPHPAPGPHDVHIWRHDHSAPLTPERISALLSVLSSEEHRRHAQLRDSRRRQQFVVGRALCRHVLSRYAPVPPQDWRFALGNRGKPFIAAPALSPRVWFNLSHTDGVSICAVTGAGPEIGIDIERTAPATDPLDIAEQFFPEAELTALRLLPPTRRPETFAQMWALKESFVKARETSLTDGLSGTTFNLARPDHLDVTFTAPLHERPKDWQFTLLRLDPDRYDDAPRIIALALRTQTAEPATLGAATLPML